jgi:formylglycine-generating enzyme required for sulfatase activity
MFDMYGNAWEWCHDAFEPYPGGAGKEPIDDREDGRPITHAVNRVLRGGSYLSQALEARSASRLEFPPHLPHTLAGLRVARTWR